MTLLVAHDLRFRIGDKTLLENVSFNVDAQERVGLVGDNGAGKSTLVKILTGSLEPDSGQVSFGKNHVIAHLSQDNITTSFTDVISYITSGLSKWTQAEKKYRKCCEQIEALESPPDHLLETQAVLANQIEELGGWNPERFAQNIASKLGVQNLDVTPEKLSGGERRRVELAKALVSNPDLLILDEPTNHLDIETIEWLEDHLTQSYKGSVLLITHDRYVLDRVVQRTLELENGHMHSYKGGWESYLIGKATRLEQLDRTESNRLNKLRKELDWLSRSPKARSTKQKARIKRAHELKDQTSPKATQKLNSLNLQATNTGKDVVVIEGLNLSFDNRQLIKNFDLIIKKGDRIGILGPNGAGKTTLLKILLGDIVPDSGQIKIGARTKFSLFSQNRESLDPDKSLMGFIADNRDTIQISGKEMHATSYLASFNFKSEKYQQKIRTLSGGEKARLALAKYLLDDGNVFLLDEPTNDLDVATLGSLESMLVDTKSTVIVVTHDRYFLDKVATSILAFESDGKIMRFESYRQALEYQKAEKDSLPAPAVKTSVKSKPVKTGGVKNLTFTEKHEFDNILQNIEMAEQNLEALNQEMSDPELYKNSKEDIQALQNKQAESETNLQKLLERWEFLESKNNGESG